MGPFVVSRSRDWEYFSNEDDYLLCVIPSKVLAFEDSDGEQVHADLLKLSLRSHKFRSHPAESVTWSVEIYACGLLVASDWLRLCPVEEAQDLAEAFLADFMRRHDPAGYEAAVAAAAERRDRLSSACQRA